MRNFVAGGALAVALAFAASPARADDLTGVNRFLCASVQATRCTEQDCLVAAPWEWNIPEFIQVDLDSKTLSTTKASGSFRKTPIKHIERDNGLIFLQGVEGGRAFSFVITQQTGFASVAVAREGITLGVFATCTPLSAPR
jgi:hypothetical protein